MTVGTFYIITMILCGVYFATMIWIITELIIDLVKETIQKRKEG